MMVLALETITRGGSIALFVDGRCHARQGDESRVHGERLPGELTDWLAAHGHALREVDVFSVISGPGSFTGLRIGLAAVQGLALPAGKRVVGVPTLDALTYGWFAAAPGRDAIVIACIDAQRGDVFVQAVDTADAGSFETARRILEPSVVSPAGVAGLLDGHLAGRRVVMIGEAAVRYADVFRGAIRDVEIDVVAMSLAEASARMAADHPDEAVSPHALRPLYVRRPDAVLARERAAAAALASGACVVRRASTTDDLAAVEALQRQTFTNPWGAEAIRWELENTDVARLYLMHDPAGVLVAYCACWMVFDELHINSLAVDTARRRQGLARQLLAHVFEEAIRAGAQSATLEVRSSNVAARGLYEELGFKVEGVRRDYYQEPREDAVILWNRALARELGPGQRALGPGQRAEGTGQKRGER